MLDNNYNLQVDESYREFILQDIKKQLPNRIEYYLNQPLRNENESPEQQKKYILRTNEKGNPLWCLSLSSTFT